MTVSAAATAVPATMPDPQAPPASICVTRSTTADREAWDAFVEASPRATFFHLWGWSQAVCDQFKHSNRGLVARRGERVVGVLPLIGCRGLRGGLSLISSAYAG